MGLSGPLIFVVWIVVTVSVKVQIMLKNKQDDPQMPRNTPKSHEIYFLIDTIYARLCFDWSVRWEHCPQCEDVFASAEKGEVPNLIGGERLALNCNFQPSDFN